MLLELSGCSREQSKDKRAQTVKHSELGAMVLQKLERGLGERGISSSRTERTGRDLGVLWVTWLNQKD